LQFSRLILEGNVHQVVRNNIAMISKELQCGEQKLEHLEKLLTFLIKVNVAHFKFEDNLEEL